MKLKKIPTLFGKQEQIAELLQQDFNSEGQKLYMENYFKPYKWTHLNEIVERGNNSRQRTGHFRITNLFQNRVMFLSS